MEIQKLLKFKGPMFPFNTDGIDPSGSNILIERVNITNWDDAVAVKPAENTNLIAKCAENILVRDIKVKYGVGATIGSVTPSDHYRCVRNVTFSNIDFDTPMKAIYIKTNPGKTTSMLPGSGGEITNITYENITMRNPVWWNIYIGPQQMKEPDGRGPGCMLYPLDPNCDT
jgi:polygalacturonase